MTTSEEYEKLNWIEIKALPDPPPAHPYYDVWLMVSKYTKKWKLKIRKELEDEG